MSKKKPDVPPPPAIEVIVGGEAYFAALKKALIKHYEDFPGHSSGCTCIDQIAASFARLCRVQSEGQYLHQADTPAIEKAGSAMMTILYRANQKIGRP